MNPELANSLKSEALQLLAVLTSVAILKKVKNYYSLKVALNVASSILEKPGQYAIFKSGNIQLSVGLRREANMATAEELKKEISSNDKRGVNSRVLELLTRVSGMPNAWMTYSKGSKTISVGSAPDEVMKIDKALKVRFGDILIKTGRITSGLN